MQRNKLAFLAFLILLLGGCDMFFYTPYTPLYRHSDPNHSIEENGSLLTPLHIKYMKVVLDKNNEKYHLKDGVLYITRSLSRNEDLLSNYTMKALYMERN